MAMKMFDKNECEYKGGYIVCEGQVVCIDNEIVDLFNKLDTDVQRAKFEAAHRQAPVDQDEAFAPKSEHGAIYPTIEAKTPELDKMAAKAVKLMDEVDAMESAARANEYFAGIHPLIMFVNDGFVVSGEQAVQHRFDLPVVGNPLELDKDKLSDIVLSMFA